MTPVEGIGERLSLALKGKNLSAISRDSGIGHSLLRKYAAGSIPGASNIPALASALGVSMIWLLTGKGEMRHSDAVNETGWQQQTSTSLPVFGLASGDEKGWFSSSGMTVRASRPRDVNSPEAFAVLAVGETAAPVGIYPGFLCICDPASAPDCGDAVFIERIDGKSALRVFDKVESGWVFLQGWHDAGQGKPKPFREEVATTQIRSIATIVYVKRKL